MATLTLKFQDIRNSKDSVMVTLEPTAAINRLRKNPEKATPAQKMALSAYSAVIEANRILREPTPFNGNVDA